MNIQFDHEDDIQDEAMENYENERRIERKIRGSSELFRESFHVCES